MDDKKERWRMAISIVLSIIFAFIAVGAVIVGIVLGLFMQKHKDNQSIDLILHAIHLYIMFSSFFS